VEGVVKVHALGGQLGTQLVEHSPLTVLLIDGEGTITWAGGPVEQLAGYRPEELVGTPMLDHVDLEWNPIAIEAAVYALSASGLQRPMLYRIRRKDGSTFIAEITANSQLDGDVGAVITYVRRWDERHLLDRVIESLARGDAVLDTVSLLVEVMGAETLEADGAVVLHPLDGRTSVVAAPGLPGELSSALPDADGPWTVASATLEPVVAACETLPQPARAVAAIHRYQRCWCWPVEVASGAGACLVLWRRTDEAPDHTSTMLLENLVRITGLVIERDQAARRLRHAADHDELTGLVNRSKCFATLDESLGEQAEEAKSADTRFVGVLYVDLDEFKPVNDRLGHAAGDEVLRVTAQRLRRAMRDNDIVARLGGDEFAIVCPRLDRPDALEPVAERVTSSLRYPITVPGPHGPEIVRIGASVGTAVAARGVCSADALLEAADAALYAAKQSGRGSWRAAPPLDRRRTRP